MLDRFALQVQSMRRAPDRILVIADLVGRRSEDGRFSPSDITGAFYELSIPPPGNVSAALATLRSESKVLRHPQGRWMLTPIGRRTLEGLAVQNAESVSLAATPAPGAVFAHTDHTVIPSWAAPPRWGPGIARLLDRYPFDQNVLCMTRFPSEGATPDPVADAIAVSRATLADCGLTLHLASDSIVDEDLFGNVGAYMWACRYGLGIVEDCAGRGLNYNVVIELGGMMLTGRRCVILRDLTSPNLPTDLAGQIYKSVDLTNRELVSKTVREWAVKDLAVPGAAA